MGGLLVLLWLPHGPIQGQTFDVMPVPARLTPVQGTYVASQRAAIRLSDPSNAELQALGAYARELLGDGFGLRLTLDPSLAPPEAYRLDVRADGIVIRAATAAGLFYGVQSLRQLVAASSDPRRIPAVTIEDQPRFAYRGMHLDVGRHFFPVAFVKRYIDLLARYKFNTFHWHLTEDQGWRIEIKKYPRLTEVGAYRKETIVEKQFDPYVGDGVPYGGFYTQEEIRDVVAYARSRYVTIVPEIEMPGHSLAALAAYPELACTPGPFEVGTRWGIIEDIYCPKEETFAFLEDVLSEVLDLFPGRYIHIGGDEAPKRRWQESPVAQAVIRREGLADEHELQSYFIRRIERFLTARGRRLIGWDEILEGGLAPTATVMSWRGMDGGIAAAKQRHDVIMTPGSHVYFDHYQGDPAYEPLAIGGYTPLEKVYAFEPIPPELAADEARHVLGAQGNVWTEYLKTPDAVEYMVLPRMLALAEVVWSPRERRSWDDFARRLPSQLRQLDAQNANYRVPHVRGLDADQLSLSDTTTVTLGALVPEATIRYTTDGSEPNEQSTPYTGPFRLPVLLEGVRVTARAFLPNGRTSPMRAARFLRTTLQEAVAVRQADLAPGLRYRYVETQVPRASRLHAYAPARQAVVNEVALRGDERTEQFGVSFTGVVHIPRDGVYEFTLTSDDGSVLEIDGRVLVDHDGYHSASDKAGQVALAAGYHTLSLSYIQGTGGKTLGLQVAAQGEARGPMPADWLFHIAAR